MKARLITLLGLIVSLALLVTSGLGEVAPIVAQSQSNPVGAARSAAQRMPGGAANVAPAATITADTENVELVSQIGGVTFAVAVQGNYAYVGVGPRLTIFDITNPASPTVVGKTAPLAGVVQGVAVAGGTAYVAGGSAGLWVVDVSTPANPREVGFYNTPRIAWGVAVAEGYAYVADWDAGLRVVDVSTPASPREVGFYDPSPGRAHSVAVAGGYVYVADEAGLRVVDISTPANPREVGFYDTPGSAWDVVTAEGYAYVADAWGGLRAVDVSDPAVPTEVGFYDTPGIARNVAVVGGYAYVTDGDGLRVMHISTPANLTEVGSYETLGIAGDVAVAGGHAYVADDYEGLRVVDVSNPANPTEVGFYEALREACDVAVAGDYAYVADWRIGLRVVDVSAPTGPTEAGSYEMLGKGSYETQLGGRWSVAIAGDYAYAADGEDGLRVVDVSTPANPTEVGFYDTLGSAMDVVVAGGYAHVADGTSGLRVVDVSTPANLTEVGFYDTPGSAMDVAVAGGYAYVVDGDGLWVMDISTPANPMEVGSYDTPGRARGVAVAGGYAYVADDYEGLRVVDVSAPANPREVGSCDTPGRAGDVVVAGDYAYVADGDGGLRVVDVSTPANPTEVGFYDTPGSAIGIAAAGGHAYVADGWGGLFILRYTGAGAAPTPTPTLEPGQAEGQIAYIGPDGNVWLISSDGTNPTRVTDDALEDAARSNVIRYCCLSWSPDGRFLTFGRAESTYTSSLRIYDIANESSHDLQDISPPIAWKADSSGFAFTMPCDGWQMDLESGDMTMLCDESLRGIWQMDLESGHRSELVPSERGYVLGHPVWSPDGRYLSFEESGLILGEPGTIEGHGLFALFEIDTKSYMPWGESIGNYSWAPSGDYLVYDQVVYLPQAGSRLWRADVRGNNRVPLTPVSTSTSDHFPRFSPTGDRIAFFRGEPAPCCTPLWVMNADGTDVYQATPFEVRYAAWSPDGQKLAVETGVYQEEEIFILNLMTGETRKITEGSYPVWQPHVPGPSVSDLLARKQAAIPRLEQTSVEILGLHFPIESYDETQAETLVQRIQEQAESDSLSPDHVEAFARLTVQEEGLAGLLPLYSQTSADLTEVGTDVVGVLLSLGREADRALEACYTSGNPFSGACQTLNRLIHRQFLRIINSLVRFTTWLIPETQQREEIRDLWMLITDSVMLRLDAGDTVQDILLSTVVKGPAVGFLVHRYVDTVQPSLDQGVRSADPTYAGSESTWPVEGQLEPAELHIEGIVEQATIRAEHAHSVHQDLMRGADLAQLLTDIADLGQLSPLTALARIAAIAARVEHLFVDVTAMAVNFNSMRCTRYLSTRAGSLAFNPNQPSENCEYIGDSSFSPPRMAREHAGGGNAKAWEPVWSHVASDVDTYEEAVTNLLAAMRDGDAEAITKALTTLDEADRVLGCSTDQAMSVILSSDVPDSEAMGALSQSNQFSLDALELYLLVASHVTAPEDERAMTGVEQAARDVLSSLGQYSESLQAAAPAGTEDRALPVVQAVVIPDEVVVEEPFEVTVAVRNAGSADASAVAVRVQAIGQEVQVAEIGTLDTNQTYTTTLQTQTTHTGTLTLLIEVAMDDSVIGSRMLQTQVGIEGSEPEERGEKPWPQPGCCPGLSGLIASTVIIAVTRVRRWPVLRSGGKLPLDHA